MSFFTNNIEIIILLIIIIVLFFMFSRVLGKKVGFKRSENKIQHINLDTLASKDEFSTEKKVNYYPEGSLQYNIEKIKDLEKNFDVKLFIEQAKKAFLLITEKFNKGELEELKPFVSDNIYSLLQENRKELSNKNKTILFKFDTFLISDIYDISFEDNEKATITVKFLTRQMKKVIDKKIINPNINFEELTQKNVSQYTDIWVFGKNLKENVSIWKLEKIISI